MRELPKVMAVVCASVSGCGIEEIDVPTEPVAVTAGANEPAPGSGDGTGSASDPADDPDPVDESGESTGGSEEEGSLDPRPTVNGRDILVDGEPFEIRGVCWSPVPRGAAAPGGIDYAGYVELDAPLMAAAGINVVRTYGALTDVAVLDELWRHGIYVLPTVYGWGGSSLDSIDDNVLPVIDHPAILMWVVGNEWNYNGLYYFDLGQPGGFETTRARVRDAAQRVKTLDDRPVVTIYGEVPSTELVDSLPEIDVWALNVYRGAGFFDLFDVWASRSTKPMFLGEYGADAYNANLPAPDPESQAYATRVLTEELRANHVSAGGVSSGGTIFEWADEWWKDGSGSLSEQDVGGVAPGGGPYPDQTFNEEWWGIVDIDRVPRPAYHELQALYTE